MAKISESLSNFMGDLVIGNKEYGIQSHNAPDLIARWSIEMETQVLVDPTKGSKVDKSVFEDSDGNRFWSFRVPRNANSTPEFNDSELNWPLLMFTGGIGCTGWNWKTLSSMWVGFDFDSITGHAAGVGVSGDELEKIKQAAYNLPYVEVRRSTGGSGLHLYVLLDNIKTENHTEHASIARCILGMMSRDAGFDFSSRIDVCGGNMWIWHRKMTHNNQGLVLIKASEQILTTEDLPSNWKDHIDVIKRKRSKVVLGPDGDNKSIDKLVASQENVSLDDEHKAILSTLRKMPYVCDWVSDHNCAQVHTKALEKLTEDMSIRGFFKTISNGSNPHEPNAFMFPISNGGWRVFRFSPGTNEHHTWTQNNDGWTNCEFNVDATFRTACIAYGGKLFNGGRTYVFNQAEDAIEAMRLMDIDVSIHESYNTLRAEVSVAKGNHIVATIDVRSDNQGREGMNDWIEDIKKRKWVFTTESSVADNSRNKAVAIDNIARMIVTPNNREVGWILKRNDNSWVWSARENVRIVLSGSGMSKVDADIVMMDAIKNPWMQVQLPFQPEYPGNRQLNLNSPQYRYTPSEKEPEDLHHPHWDMILKHCFKDLDSVLHLNRWAVQNGIRTGYDYGLAWLGCLLREPFQPLPYLFLYGDQNCGKSILHEATKMLMTSGVVMSDKAFTGGNEFNGELANAVLAVLEEVDLSGNNKESYNKIKAWVTSPTISIRKMRTDAYDQPNTLHFIHVTNDRSYCPIIQGDTRIVMLYVGAVENEIPKSRLFEELEKEGPDFMQTLLNLQLPSLDGRMRLSPVMTASKMQAENANRDELKCFLDEYTTPSHEASIPFSEFYKRFVEFLPDSDKRQWSKKRVSASLPSTISTERTRTREVIVPRTDWRVFNE